MIIEPIGIMNRVRHIGRTGRAGASLLAIVTAGLLTGCALVPSGEYYEKRDRVTEAEAHTSGQALAQRKSLMRRAHRDLLNAEQTLVSLRRHRYREDTELLRGVMRSYLSRRVDPLLSSKKTGWHPELVTLDANLLLAKAAVLIEIDDRRGADRVIRGIESRFEGLDSLLVESSLGTQSTLDASLAALRKRRWAR